MTEDEIVEWHQQLNGVDQANSMSLIKLWETVIKTIPKKKKCIKAKWLSEEAL